MAHTGGTEYTEGVTYSSSGQVTITVTADTPNLYYYCSSHPEWVARQQRMCRIIWTQFLNWVAGDLSDFPVIDPQTDTVSQLIIKDNVAPSGDNDIVTSLG